MLTTDKCGDKVTYVSILLVKLYLVLTFLSCIIILVPICWIHCSIEVVVTRSMG